MKVRIVKPITGGTVRAIASKSEAHRLLICSALAKNDSFITCSECSEDIDATARCLKTLGAELKYSDGGFYVKPIDRKRKPQAYYNLDCGESGATLRFMLPVCGALGFNVSFKMNGRLSERPLSILKDEMESHGCVLSYNDKSTLTCKGRLKSGLYTLKGDVSSQFISGLLLGLPLLDGDSAIHVTNVIESRPYVDMTLDAVSLFGVKVFENDAQVFSIPGGQVGTAPKNITVAGDWSNAAFWLTAGVMVNRGVTCTGLDLNSRQGDRAIINLLQRFGAAVSCDQKSVTVIPGKLRGIDIDAKDTPDLVPVLAAAACVAEGKTVIRNAGRLRIKESDRLNTVAKSLSSLGADIKEAENGLIINGKKKLAGGQTQSYGDHRIAMTVAILSSVCTEEVVIQNAEAVNKSYPVFFDDFISLGGVCEYLR